MIVYSNSNRPDFFVKRANSHMEGIGRGRLFIGALKLPHCQRHFVIVALSIPIPSWGSALLAPAGVDPCIAPINSLPLPLQ